MKFSAQSEVEFVEYILIKERINQMKYSHILWDFNGTLFNDVNVGIESANILLERHGLNKLKNADEYKKVFCFPIIEYYKKLGFDFNETPYENLAIEWVEIYNSISHKASLFDGALEVLKYINESCIPQFVLSATEKNMLMKQVNELEISQYFCEILGTGDIYAYSKETVAINWKNKIKPKRALLIGDTIHDADVAKAAGFDCILVANGHENKERLMSVTENVVDSIKDVLKFF